MEKKELRRNGEVRLRHPYKAVHGRTWPYTLTSATVKPRVT